MSDTKFGKCPWCERHEQMLYFAIGAHDGKLWCDYICAKCLNAAREWQGMPGEQLYTGGAED